MINGLAIGSLVCGLFWGWGLGSVAAVILGYIALRQIRREPLRLKGRGMAIAGIAFGWLGIVGVAVLIAVGVHYWKMREARPDKPHQQQVHLTTASLALRDFNRPLERGLLAFARPRSRAHWL